MSDAISPRGILVFGGCVSRDALAFSNLESSLVGYYARSSFGTFAGKPFLQTDVLSAISSKFQRRCVEADMRKSFLARVRRRDYDILLIDLLSQRYNLLSLEGGGVLTLSNEYVKANPRFSSVGNVLTRGTDAHFEMWIKGAEAFISQLQKSGVIHRLRISKLFWVEESSRGADYHSQIQLENSYLRALYRELETRLPRDCFIEYPPELFVADPQHKWGEAPYHYTKPLYAETVRQLSAARTAVGSA